jgi:hypothetical protein
MSTPESTAEETSDLETSASAKQDELTRSVGTTLEPRSASEKAPWWKRLLGRS